MESETEISPESVDPNQLIFEHHSSNFYEVNMKCMAKRSAQTCEDNMRKVPKLSCLHLSPNATSCDPRIFPVSIVKEEISNGFVNSQNQPQNAVEEITFEEKNHTPVRSGKEMNKLVAQKIAIGM